MSNEMTGVEEKVAFLERHVEELDSAVREVFEKLEQLRAEFERHRADTQQQIDARERSIEDDKPPHWGGS